MLNIANIEKKETFLEVARVYKRKSHTLSPIIGVSNTETV